MIKYRVMHRPKGYAIERQTDTCGWRRIGVFYKNKGSAMERMRLYRSAAEKNYRGDVGQRIMASMPFCGGVL